MLRGQIAQLVVSAVLVALALPFLPPASAARGWYVSALAACVLHHGWVSACWRLELHARWISRALGHPRGFRVYRAGFVLLVALRVGAVCGLSVADAGTLGLPRAVGWPLAAACLGLAAYLLASVRRHFGLDRAFGLDHWEPERFRGRPLVRRGIHRLTPNAMYAFAPAIPVAPALLLDSRAAVAATVFNAACLWAHYLCTERPDLRVIYGPETSGADRV